MSPFSTLLIFLSPRKLNSIALLQSAFAIAHILLNLFEIVSYKKNQLLPTCQLIPNSETTLELVSTRYLKLCMSKHKFVISPYSILSCTSTPMFLLMYSFSKITPNQKTQDSSYISSHPHTTAN